MKLQHLRDDHPLSLLDAAEILGRFTGKKPHVSTLWRWCLKGCKGVVLESICIGGKRFVTAAAIEQFIEEVTATRRQQREQPSPGGSQPPAARTMIAHVMRHNDRRRDEIEVARRRLDEITGAAKPPTTPA
jgi:hypothetical protein